MDKNNLRKEMQAKRSALTEEEIARMKISLTMYTLAVTEWRRAKTVMLYCEFKNEAPADGILREAFLRGKTVVLPYTNENFEIIPYVVPALKEEYFRTSPLGIREPNPETCEIANPGEIDLVIIPGIAFDKQGHRLGYGKGCYDRFLPEVPAEAPKIALAYDFQVVEGIPSEPTDIPVTAIITPSGMVYQTL